MSDMPDDIMKAAGAAIHAPNADIHGNTLRYFLDERYVDMATIVIARAILSERERSSQLLSEAENREREARETALEDAAAIADKEAAWRERLFKANKHTDNAAKSAQSRVIADAIRALKSEANHVTNQ
ncbi:hypothetical protein [Agrobacterium tumefaciens]|uniref:hypothetical protein n=1 Tax=Agrobacterium tumefaciens TaxID=358 RepID=UPI0021CFFFB2|nr:hypothetical protein [Agrobacterium tumefaciens]UXS01684.1 hypothetical protein FY156_09495 [Agrobacterium tumefaciens]